MATPLTFTTPPPALESQGADMTIASAPEERGDDERAMAFAP